ncbi:hypothetical protein DRH27_05295, partial [Candidatus Falkowbacteria bacterium]
MKKKIMVIGAIMLVFLLPASLTYVYFTSSFLEDNTAKIFAYFGQPSCTKADQIKMEKEIKEMEDLKKRIVKKEKANELLKKKKQKQKVKDLFL